MIIRPLSELPLVTRTLVLVVDRDDDYGEKGGVETPLIGIDAATKAAIALGTADPEDSDVNALLAAMNIYNELSGEGKEVEIALVCGDKKVGYKSDSALIDELNSDIKTIRLVNEKNTESNSIISRNPQFEFRMEFPDEY